MEFKRGKEIASGKTKAIYAVEGNPSLAIMVNQDQITKHDDPSLTQTMASKAIHATKTTSCVFELLKQAGIPVAFESQLSPTEILVKKCQMLPLEVIIRRYAVGSYLERRPDLKSAEAGAQPRRFHKLVFELFLKTTGGDIKTLDGGWLGKVPDDVLKLDKVMPVDDPFITDPHGVMWELKHPKLPAWDKRNFPTSVSVRPENFLPSNRMVFDTIAEIEEITRKTFLVLESAWANLGYRLIDFKIEFGIDANGELRVADVIDNDSWRLRTDDWKELSKQLFRDNHSMSEISEKYALVSALTEKFSIPEQALVFWLGSDKDIDRVPINKYSYSGVKISKVIKSGHKSPLLCLQELESILAGYPAGGVIISLVGLSNGLGPLLAARTSWPVIAVPAGGDNNNVWSSLAMPSNVPLLTALSVNNAVLAAYNILSQKNPALYMIRQYELENLDGNLVC